MITDVDITNIYKYKNICYNASGSINPTTELIVKMMKIVGISELRVSNFEEFFIRYNMVLLFDPSDNWLTLSYEDVVNHIGLSIRSVKQLTNKGWHRKLLAAIRRKAENAMEESREEYCPSG